MSREFGSYEPGYFHQQMGMAAEAAVIIDETETPYNDGYTHEVRALRNGER